MQVLLVEDSPVYRKLVGTHLENWGFKLVIAQDGSDAWGLLQHAECPKLILLDWVLPGMDGIDICRKIRQAKGPQYSYIIILTGKDARKDMLEAMQAGADDYLVKPFDELELKARLLVGKRILALQEELVAAQESMRHAATHDSLTGLMNRGEIMDTLRRELERARRSEKPVCVILGDLDRFKDINDTCGHLFGDEVLREVGRRLRAKLRVYDAVGRYGGEEFLMILPGCDAMTGIIRADQLRLHVASKPIVSARGSRSVTMSLGVAVSNEVDCNDVEALLNHADKGLYLAKKNGRNRVEHVEVDMPKASCAVAAAAKTTSKKERLSQR
jgi:two-component system cell cycle response regulator